MEPALIELFTQLILTQTGLSIRSQDYPGLVQKINIRVKALKFQKPEIYFNLLSTDTPNSRQEWKELIPLITTIESYFFRDQGQINLLRKSILPELIASRQQTKTLKLWSAGCSTGEEPYTLSILVQQLLPDWANWNIHILGTDVNEQALNKAKQGLYTSWSFRMVDPELRNQYFVRKGQDWKINSVTQNSVQFFNLNLVKDSYRYPNYTPIKEVDLIICRNVFVYFDREYINQVITNFYDALKPGGYLITGHAELQNQEATERFQSKIYPESMVYQRPLHCTEESLASRERLMVHQGNILEVLVSPPLKNQNVYTQKTSIEVHKLETVNSSKLILEEAKKYFKNKQYRMAIQKAEQFLQTYNNSWEHRELESLGQKDIPENHKLRSDAQFDAYYLLAKASANLGLYEQAILYCKKAIEIDSLSVSPYYLLLHVAQEREDLEGAKLLSKRIIYLLPSSIPAYLELGSIYEQEGDQTRATKMYSTALELLKSLPPSMGIEHLEGVTAEDLIIFLEKKRLAVDC